jgi:hypothetical protein
MFIVLLIMDKDKEVNNLSHLFISVSGLAERVIKTPLARP